VIFRIARCSRRLEVGVAVSLILSLCRASQTLLYYPSFLIVFADVPPSVSPLLTTLTGTNITYDRWQQS
jgi:hypothetical protein